MKQLNDMHPGEVLQEEFLVPFGISAYRLSKEIGIPQSGISQIRKSRRRITTDTASRLSKFFGNSPKFWPCLQDDLDIEDELRDRRPEIDRIKRSDKAA